MDTLRQDLRYTLRQLVKNPGFTAVATVTLALGIGANTAIFSVLNSVLLRPLPYDHPEELVQIWETNPKVVAERDVGFSDIGVNALNYLDYRTQATAFTDMGYVIPYADDGMIQVGGGDGVPERVWAWSVSGSVFSVLGVQPMLGRTFLPEERAPSDQMRWTDVVILSHELWQRRFGSDTAIIGRHITIEAGRATVIGVMPPGFSIPPMYDRGSIVFRNADIYLPLFYRAFAQPRRFRQFKVVARLKPGVSLARAQSEMRTIARRLEAVYPEANAGWTAVVTPLRTLLVGDFGGGLFLLMGAVGFVLLIACGNVANLLIVRGAARRTEIAIRTALGGGRSRLVRHLLTESTLLAFLGGAAGLLLAAWGTDLLVALVPANVPRAAESGIDARVLGFTLGLSVLTGLGFGLLPAFKLSQVNPIDALKLGESGRASEQGGWRVSRFLVMGQVAMALLLLIGGGMLMKSFIRLRSVDPGFDSRNVLVANLHFGAHDALTSFAPGTPEERRARSRRRFAFSHEALERIRALPGAEAAATTSQSPLDGSTSLWPLKIEDRPGERQNALAFHVSPDYFRTMRIPLVQGEGFPEWDGISDWEKYNWDGGCTEFGAYCVAIVSETLARTLWPGQDPLGKRIGIYDCCLTVVGVVRDVSYRGVDDPPLIGAFDPGFQLYLPFTGDALLVRTAVDPLTLTNAVRAIVLELASEAVVSFTTLDSRLSASLARPRFYMLLVGIFAVAAVILALVGLYGVVAYSVRQRTREIGLRMALGAERSEVLTMVIRQGMIPVVLGILVGAGGALALGRLLSGLLYGMEAVDPVIIAALAALMVCVAVLASYVPARWASNVAPMEALRYE